MMTGKKVLLAGLAAVLGVAMIGATGCVRVELPKADNESWSTTLGVGGAEEVSVEVAFGAGELNIGSTNGELLDADFVYPDDSWKPDVDYRVDGTEGRLSIKQPSHSNIRLLQDQRHVWDVMLGGDVPMELTVDMGAGVADLRLGGLMLSELTVNLGAGDCTLDLGGTPTLDLDAEVRTGAGALTIRIPRGVAARISGVHDGLGDFSADGFRLDGETLVNEAYDDGADVTFEINVQRGVGDVVIELVD